MGRPNVFFPPGLRPSVIFECVGVPDVKVRQYETGQRRDVGEACVDVIGDPLWSASIERPHPDRQRRAAFAKAGWAARSSCEELEGYRNKLAVVLEDATVTGVGVDDQL